jgi:pimeloyl-ACP methyl ester carboxylesterase
MPKPRLISLVLLGLVVAGLGFLNVRPPDTYDVPGGARSGELALQPCEYTTESGDVPADCGALVVPENRRDPASDLIALPVVRIRAAGPVTGDPIFRLNGGPGATNLEFPQAGRLLAGHDVVLVGYRGVDGSRRLDCPEVDAALRSSADLASDATQRAATDGFTACSRRLTDDGVDLTGYSIPQRADDLEAARTALGYSRINLLSTSAGTRTAMVYAWRHPASLHRSAMIAVNPPGHFIWDPRVTDRQFARYAELCRADVNCSGRTADLTADMRKAAADVPGRWGPFRIKDGNVRVSGMFGMFVNGPGSAPLNAPTLLDAYLGAEPAGLWALSVLTDLVIPTSFVWGEFASFGMIDAPAAERYYAAGGDPGSILGNKATDLLWGGPDGFHRVWPDSPDNAEYRTPRPSDVETLLVGGSVDFSTPPESATRELLPTLNRGHQVTLAELGHTGDFWEHQPDAGTRLLTTFYDTGTVDSAGFSARPVDFTPDVGLPTIGRVLAGFVIVAALLTLILLGLMLRRARRRGFSRRAGIWLRVLTPLPFGIGGWLCGVLLIWTVHPQIFIGGAAVVVPSVGLVVGLSTYAAAPHRHPVWTVTAALLGAALGFGAAPDLAALLTTIAGAAAGANLALLAPPHQPHPGPAPGTS